MKLGNVIFNKLKGKQWITWQKFLPIAGVARVWRPTSWAGPRPSRKSLNWLSEAKRTPGKITIKAKQHRIILCYPQLLYPSSPLPAAGEVGVTILSLILTGSQAPPAPPRPSFLLQQPSSSTACRLLSVCLSLPRLEGTDCEFYI